VKQALIASVSLATLLLVGSCGTGGSDTSVTTTEPVTTLDAFQLDGSYDFKVFCRKGDKYYVSDVYHGWDLEVFPGHKDCEGK
jgi:hypothetical protein